MPEKFQPAPVTEIGIQNQSESTVLSRAQLDAQLMADHGYILADHFIDPLSHNNPRVMQDDRKVADSLIQSLVTSRREQNPGYEPSAKDISADLSGLYRQARDCDLTPNKQLMRNIMTSARASFKHNRWNSQASETAHIPPQPVQQSFGPFEQPSSVLVTPALTIAPTTLPSIESAELIEKKRESRFRLRGKALAAVGSLALAATVAWARLTSHETEPAKHARLAESFRAPATYTVTKFPQEAQIFPQSEAPEDDFRVGQTAQVTFHFPKGNGEFEEVDGGEIVFEKKLESTDPEIQNANEMPVPESVNGLIQVSYENPAVGIKKEFNRAHSLHQEQGKPIETSSWGIVQLRLYAGLPVAGGWVTYKFDDGDIAADSMGEPFYYDSKPGQNGKIHNDPRIDRKAVVFCGKFERQTKSEIGPTTALAVLPLYRIEVSPRVAMVQP